MENNLEETQKDTQGVPEGLFRHNGGTMNGGDWNAWSRHVLLELKRLNTNIEGLQGELSSSKEQLVVATYRRDECMKRDIFTKVEENTKFRENMNRFFWRVVLVAFGSSGAITALINSLMNGNGCP